MWQTLTTVGIVFLIVVFVVLIATISFCIVKLKRLRKQISDKKDEYVNLLDLIETSIEKNETLTDRNHTLQQSYDDLKIKEEILTNQVIVEQRTLDEIISHTSTMRQTIDEDVEAYRQKALETMQAELANSAQKEADKYQEAIEEYKEMYTSNLEEIAKDFSSQIDKFGITAKEAEETLLDLRKKVNAAIKTFMRALAEKSERDFYRVQISKVDKEEIKKLREIIPLLRNPEPLNKVIYKVYYENPSNDMINRVTDGHTSGIYKITNIIDNKCYVGQTNNFANRWKQHIKRGVGAETPTRNKLYPAMMEDGVENFTFEIIEDCPVDKLNEREDYWQDFWHAKEFGYSIR